MFLDICNNCDGKGNCVPECNMLLSSDDLEFERELARLIEKKEHTAKCAREEEDREYRADMYRMVDRLNDAILQHISRKKS